MSLVLCLAHGRHSVRIFKWMNKWTRDKSIFPGVKTVYLILRNVNQSCSECNLAGNLSSLHIGSVPLLWWGFDSAVLNQQICHAVSLSSSLIQSIQLSILILIADILWPWPHLPFQQTRLFWLPYSEKRFTWTKRCYFLFEANDLT